jgi:hypothetical protein
MEEITKHSRRRQMLGQRLGSLSVDQIQDCFRAAGYAPDEIDGYAKTAQDRIAALNSL